MNKNPIKQKQATNKTNKYKAKPKQTKPQTQADFNSPAKVMSGFEPGNSSIISQTIFSVDKTALNWFVWILFQQNRRSKRI